MLKIKITLILCILILSSQCIAQKNIFKPKENIFLKECSQKNVQIIKHKIGKIQRERRKKWEYGLELGINTITRITKFDNPFIFSQTNIYSNNNTIKIALNEIPGSVYKIMLDGKNPINIVNNYYIFTDITTGKHKIKLVYGSQEKEVDLIIKDEDKENTILESEMTFVQPFFKINLADFYVFSPFNLYTAIEMSLLTSGNNIDGSGLYFAAKLGYEKKPFRFGFEILYGELGFPGEDVTQDIFTSQDESSLPPYKIFFDYNFFNNFRVELNTATNFKKVHSFGIEISYLYRIRSRGY